MCCGGSRRRPARSAPARWSGPSASSRWRGLTVLRSDGTDGLRRGRPAPALSDWPGRPACPGPPPAGHCSPTSTRAWSPHTPTTPSPPASWTWASRPSPAPHSPASPNPTCAPWRTAARTNGTGGADGRRRGDPVHPAGAATGRVLTVHITVGTRLPAASTSLGRVLLADTEPALTDVRTQGYALVDEELESGLRSIAVLVRDRTGRRPPPCPAQRPTSSSRTSTPPPATPPSPRPDPIPSTPPHPDPVPCGPSAHQDAHPRLRSSGDRAPLS
ncbi:IclR family transcriptional regulator C-terminal domain-containing protein [Streptomyces sp. NPDC005890]|uniref:IclR family transcriptional regulator domain-containing protein n=1 Tax=Streptomyces sp. NPDC005890 TaxID=3154568 RepID=UPI0033FB258F